MKSLFAVLASTLILTACATSGRKIDPNAVEKIHKGTSTRADVRAAMGAPDQITKIDGTAERWMYFYARAQVKGETFIPFVGGFVGGVNTQTQSVVVSFGSDGVVSSVESSMGGSDVSNGLSAGGAARVPEVENGKRPK